jgi:hypothetical protein
VTAHVGGNVEKEEHSSIAGGIPNWYNYSGNQSGGSSENWKISKDPAIPCLRIYPKDAPPCHRGTCSTMFIVALSVMVRSWKQPNVPRQKNGYRKCGSFTQRNTIQVLKTRTS